MPLVVVVAIVLVIIIFVVLSPDDDSIVVAVVIPFATTAVPIHLILVVAPSTVVISLTTALKVVVIFLPSLPSHNTSVVHFGSLDDLVRRFFTLENDLLRTSRLLDDDRRRCWLRANDDGVGLRLRSGEVLCRL